jgi:hypothetical protein
MLVGVDPFFYFERLGNLALRGLVKMLDERLASCAR